MKNRNSNFELLRILAMMGVVALHYVNGAIGGVELYANFPNFSWAFTVAVRSLAVPLVNVFVLITGYYMVTKTKHSYRKAADIFVTVTFYSIVIYLVQTALSGSPITLKELGKLQNFIGTTVMSAAIIDDVIGIIVVTLVIGFKDPSAGVSKVIVQTLLFFAFALVFGVAFHKVFKLFERRYVHTRRIPIVGLALAFSLSYIAQRFFSVADITGAYIAGVILCSTKDSGYIARKMDINSYMLFGPIFFASIGLQTNIRTVDSSVILFSLAFVFVGMLSKVVGCGGISRLLGFNALDSLKIGCGMMTRGEVALIVAQRGLAAGLLEHSFFTAVILLIIVSSVMTPVILKAVYTRDGGGPVEAGQAL